MHYFTIEQRESLQARLQALRNDPAAAGLPEIEAALKRLHTADFGLCADCGAEIPFAFLQAHLVAIRCPACDAKRAQAGPPNG